MFFCWGAQLVRTKAVLDQLQAETEASMRRRARRSFEFTDSQMRIAIAAVEKLRRTA
jgi:hypothetical protein